MLDMTIGHMTVTAPLGITARRVAFAEEMLAHPEWRSRDIYNRALAIGLWPDDGPYEEEPERNKKRVRGLRQLGKKLGGDSLID